MPPNRSSWCVLAHEHLFEPVLRYPCKHRGLGSQLLEKVRDDFGLFDWFARIPMPQSKRNHSTPSLHAAKFVRGEVKASNLGGQICFFVGSDKLRTVAKPCWGRAVRSV